MTISRRKPPKKPIGLGNFGTLIQGLLGVNKGEFDAEMQKDARERKRKRRKTKAS